CRGQASTQAATYDKGRVIGRRTAVEIDKSTLFPARASPNGCEDTFPSTSELLEEAASPKILVPPNTVNDRVISVCVVLKAHNRLCRKVQGRIATSRVIEECYVGAGAGIDGGV